RHAVDAPAPHVDLAGAGRKTAGNQIEQRGLAGAVRPDQTVPFARLDRQVGSADDPQGAEGLLDSAQLQGGRLGGPHDAGPASPLRAECPGSADRRASRSAKVPPSMAKPGIAQVASELLRQETPQSLIQIAPSCDCSANGSATSADRYSAMKHPPAPTN